MPTNVDDATMEEWDGRLVSAARALARLTIKELAAAAGVTRRTVDEIEADAVVLVSPRRRHGYTSSAVWNRIVEALAGAGVELLPERNGCGAGVRWIEPRSARRVRTLD